MRALIWDQPEPILTTTDDHNGILVEPIGLDPRNGAAQVNDDIRHRGPVLLYKQRVTHMSPVMPVAVAASALLPSVAAERGMSRAPGLAVWTWV